MSLEARVGRFSIAACRHADAFAEWYDDAQCVLERVVVVRCEMHLIRNELEYVAYSSLFDEIEEGEQAPEYRAILSRNEHEHPVFERFERV